MWLSGQCRTPLFLVAFYTIIVIVVPKNHPNSQIQVVCFILPMLPIPSINHYKRVHNSIIPQISVPSAAVTIDAYPSTQPVPLGTTVVLVCRVGSIQDNSSASYEWSCPNSDCDISTGTRGTPRSRIVSGNTLTVNVVSKSDRGEYRCTVSEGGTTQTSSYDMTVAGECFAIRQMVVRMKPPDSVCA